MERGEHCVTGFISPLITRWGSSDHNASLIAFYLTFGDIMSTDMLIACLKRNARKRVAAAE